jgi:heptosyltransferase-3
MRILFTKLRHIGDNLLITPAIVATRRKFPNAEIWVAVRRGTSAILAGCPEIDRIVTTARPEEGRRTWRDFRGDLATLAEIATTRFDYALELGENDRGRILTLASGAPVRATRQSDLGPGKFWRGRFTHVLEDGGGTHQVEVDYSIPRVALGLAEDPPALRFDPAATQPWDGAGDLEEGSFAVLHAATRWPGKAWPPERWREVLRTVLAFTPRVIVSCGPSTREIAEAEALCEGLGSRVVTTGGTTSWRQLAWILGRAAYYVGVDTAAMHLASAMQCPVVCLFGTSIPGQFGPWKSPHIMVAPAGRKPGEEPESPGLRDNPRMLQITVDEVVAACSSARGMRARNP